MNDTSDRARRYRLDTMSQRLTDDRGRQFDQAMRRWREPGSADPGRDSPQRSAHVGNPCEALEDGATAGGGEVIDALAAVRWLQRGSGAPLRVPIGVVGPRAATPSQLDASRKIGAGLAGMGLAVVCGGRQGVMQAVAQGASEAGGVCIGLLPDDSAEPANRYLTHVIATGLGEARNAIIARAAYCLIAIGDSYGTLSEVALGLQFGKRVFGLEGAARVAGVEHLPDAEAALAAVAAHILG